MSYEDLIVVKVLLESALEKINKEIERLEVSTPKVSTPKENRSSNTDCPTCGLPWFECKHFTEGDFGHLTDGP